MIINSIKLNNFGIYKGENSYSFDVDDTKNIVVINGNNGSGKTTLLEALKISLYGPYYLGYQTDNDKYYSFIENKLNAYAIESFDSEFGLEINISLWERGGHNEYSVSRTWEYNKNKLKETVTVMKNGLILNVDESNNFFMHLQSHFPLNLFNVFFFDGEQLDRLFLLDRNPNNIDEFSNLFNTLFNIDLFTQLKKDIRNYLKQKNVYSNLSSHEKEYTDMLEEQEGLEILIQDNHETIESLKSEKEATMHQLEALEKDFKNIGGLTNDLTNKLNNEIKELEELKKSLEFENKRILNEYLPFMILNDELNTLINQLDQEKVNHEHNIIKNSLDDPNLIKFLKSDKKINNDNVNLIVDKFKDYFSVVESPDLEYDLSVKDYYFIKSLKDDLVGIQNYQLKINNVEIEELNKKIYTLQQKLNVSHSEEVDEILNNVKEIQKSIAHFDEAITTKENDLETLKSQLEAMVDKLADLKKVILYTKKDENIFTIIDKLEKVIDAYVSESKKQKLSKLEHYTAQMFNNLIRKEDFIKGIKIEKESGNIKIINSLGKVMPATNLSAGERQIYVLSLIWGLLKISDKRIPLVFDTLLGRLDKSHKNNILQHFLHTTGEQVIVLATDSELSDESLNCLDPYVKTSYAIDFNSIDRDVKIFNRSKVV